jgi:hypothetical protein
MKGGLTTIPMLLLLPGLMLWKLGKDAEGPGERVNTERENIGNSSGETAESIVQNDQNQNATNNSVGPASPGRPTLNQQLLNTNSSDDRSNQNINLPSLSSDYQISPPKIGWMFSKPTRTKMIGIFWVTLSMTLSVCGLTIFIGKKAGWFTDRPVPGA